MSSADSRTRVAERAATVRTWALFAFFVALAVRPGGAGSLLLALASAVLWLVAEGVAGYQEPRSALSSPGSGSQDRRHQHT